MAGRSLSETTPDVYKTHGKHQRHSLNISRHGPHDITYSLLQHGFRQTDLIYLYAAIGIVAIFHSSPTSESNMVRELAVFLSVLALQNLRGARAQSEATCTDSAYSWVSRYHP